MRRWHEAATWEWNFLVTPNEVQILAGVARNFITQINIGREFNTSGAVPRLGPDVPRWYGETIGFWDKDVLITWTSNIQGWFAHGAFEYSNKMQAIEIYSSRPDASGKFVLKGLPAGSGDLVVWHDRATPWHQKLSAGGKPLAIQLDLTQKRVPPHMNKFGKPYGRASDAGY
jgi:hypothetical protein